MTKVLRARFMLAIFAIAGASCLAIPARAATFSLAVSGVGNPALKIEVSAENFCQTRELGANGRTVFDISGTQRTIYQEAAQCSSHTASPAVGWW